MRPRFAALFSLAAAACDPPAIEFQGEPLRVCAGDHVTLSWQITGAQGDASLETIPADGEYQQQPAPPIGSVSRAISGPTEFRIIAANDHGPNQKAVSVTTFSPGAPPLLQRPSRSVSCVNGSFPSSVTIAPIGGTSPRLRVVEVSPQLSRNLRMVSVSGPGRGDLVGAPWTVNFTYVGPSCPQPGVTRDPGVPLPESQAVSLVVTAACS